MHEGSRKGIFEMLEQIQKKSTLSTEQFSAKARIVEGDWLTVNNLRLSQGERARDKDSFQQSDYAMTLSALWHDGMNAAKMMIKTHRGDKVFEPASLSSAKESQNRTFDMNSPEYAPAKALIRHVP